MHLPVFCQQCRWWLWFLAALSCTTLPLCHPFNFVKLLIPARVTNSLWSSFQPVATCRQQSDRKWTTSRKIWMCPQPTSIDNVKWIINVHIVTLTQRATHMDSVLKQWLFLPLLLKTHGNIATRNKSGAVLLVKGRNFLRVFCCCFFLQKYWNFIFWVLEPYFKVLDSTVSF